jgi:hypothetical protein
MLKRPTPYHPGALASLARSIGLLVGRLIQVAPASPPVGGPVVFRHYL